MSRTKASLSHLQLSDLEGRLAWKLCFHIFSLQTLRDLSHESLAFTSSAFRHWGTSRRKALFSHFQLADFERQKPRTIASLSHLQLSDFERSLPRQLRFHIFSSQNCGAVSHESFAFASLAFRLWGMSRTKASFSHLQRSDFEGILARKLRFHIFSFQTLKGVSQERFVFTSSAFRLWGKSRTKGAFSHLQLADFEGCLAGKVRFHIFSLQTLREVSNERFVFTSSACRIWGESRTKASFSHLQRSGFEGHFARKLRIHIFSFQTSKEVSHESFLFTSSAFRLWGKSRTRGLLSHLQLADFEGSLARKLRCHIFSLQTLRDVSHESFVFTSFRLQTLRDSSHKSSIFLKASACRLSGMSRTKALFSHLQLCRLWEMSRTKAFVFTSSAFRLWATEDPHESFACHIFSLQTLRDVSHESFAFKSSAFRLWGMSCTKASFLHFQLADFERQKSRTKASHSHLQLSDFEGSRARKLRFHIFNVVWFWWMSRTKASLSHL